MYSMSAIISQLILIFGRMHRMFHPRLLTLILIFSSGLGRYVAQPLSGILPKNQSNLSNFNVSFQWNSAPNTINYRVQFASNNTFSSNYTQSPLTNLTSWSSFVPTQGTYYWRVKAYTANDSTCSPTYTFTYFTPSNLNSTSLWLKADAGVTLDASNKVQQWSDLSANSHVMSQNLAAKRPTVVNNSVNGYPSISFAGAQVLSGGDILDLGFNSRSMFVVGKMAASNQTLLAKSRAANATFRYALLKDGTSTAFLFQSDNNTSNYSAFNSTNFALYNAFVNRTTAKNHLDVNNSSLGISSFNSNLLFESNFRFLIGAYNNANDDGELLFLNGNICEIIFADSNDSLDILKIKNYLKFKYTPVFNLGSDINITNGFCPQSITAPAGFSNYQWSTGATTASISVNQSGSYWVSANDAFGFKWTDTIFVKFPTIAPPPSTSICSNSSVLWNTGLGAGYTHLWNTGSTANQLTITQGGTYSVQVTGAGGCPSPAQQATFTLDTYPLTCSLGNDTSLCIGNVVSLQQGAQQTISYVWNDGTNGSTFPMTNGGMAVISLTSTNLNGCVAQDTILVNVNGTAPTINVSLPITHCTNSLFQASNQSSVPLPAVITSQVWSFSNGIQLNGNTVQTTFPITGWIYGSMEVTASDNCSTLDTFSFYVQMPPSLNIQHSGSCNNELVFFQASDLSGNQLITYAWDYLGGIVDTDSIGSHMFSQAGLNQIALVAQNTFGCSDTAQYTFNVSAAPSSIFSINNSCEQTITVPVNASIANDSTGIQSVLWNFGNGSNSSTFNAPCFYASSGNYSVSLICYAGNGCTDTSTQVVTIHPMPELNWNVAPACKDNPTVFSSSSTIPSGSIDSTFWLVNLQYPFIGIEGQYSFTTLGIQFLTLSAVSNMGCQADTLIQVNVNPGLSSSFDYEPAICIAGDELTLSSTANGSNTIDWVINGVSYEDTISLNYLIPDSLIGGDLFICSITSNLYGCSDTTLKVISINEPLLELALNQVYLGSQNSQSIIGCSLQNEGTVSILGGILTLSVSGVPRLSGTLNDTILPGDSYYYIFENSPNLAGLSQNNMVDFLCVSANLTGFHFMEELDLSNNYTCLLIEEGTFSLGELSPNPVTNQSDFPLILTEKTPVTVEVIDVLGNLCTRSENTLEAGTHVLSVLMNDKAAGIYFLRVRVGSEHKILQFIKI
jgi:hypothetical protein